MNTKGKNSLAALTLICVVSLFFSCKKKLTDPKHLDVATGPSVTIQDLRNMYANQSIKFTSNSLLHCVVTMDETSGNIYKQVYIRDNSGSAATNGYGAISLHLLSSSNGFLSTGDSIALNLNGITLDMSTGGSLQLDSIMPTASVIKIKTGLNPLPLLVTLPQLNTQVGGAYVYDAQLVQMNNVEFVQPNVGQPYAVGQNPPAAPISYNRYLNDCIGNTMITYNSGFANFAYSAASPITIPNASGSVVAVSNVYNTMQLTLRSYPEINLSASYCPVVYDTITQNFSCGAIESKKLIMTAGWKSFDIQGSLTWTGLSYGVAPNIKYAPSVSNYKTTDTRNDIWFVSPPILDNAVAHGSSSTKLIDFSSTYQYPTPSNRKLLSVLVSRTFDGTNIIPSQWTDISTSAVSPLYKINSSALLPNFQYAHNSAASKYLPAPVAITISGSSSTFYLAFRYQSNLNVADSTGVTQVLGTLILK